jgi:hypothetical protein
MKSAIGALIKNFLLVSILALSALNFFYGWLNWKELLAVQCLTGLVYIFISCYEYMNASYKASLPIRRYPYFNNSYIMFKALKVGIFLGLGILLYSSGSRVKYLYPICFIIATTELVITFLKYSKSLCFINIYANYLLISQDKISKLFASEIMVVEFRHEILYFVKKDRKTVQIKLEHIRKRENFLRAINEWINRNNVWISAESRSKIKESITLY